MARYLNSSYVSQISLNYERHVPVKVVIKVNGGPSIVQDGGVRQDRLPRP